MLDSGISDPSQGAIPPALRYLVGAAADREQRHTAPKKCRTHHFGDGLACEKGIAPNEEGPDRFHQRDSLDSRFQDAQWRCGNPADELGIGSLSESDRKLGERRVPLSQ